MAADALRQVDVFACLLDSSLTNQRHLTEDIAVESIANCQRLVNLGIVALRFLGRHPSKVLRLREPFGSAAYIPAFKSSVRM